MGIFYHEIQAYEKTYIIHGMLHPHSLSSAIVVCCVDSLLFQNSSFHMYLNTIFYINIRTFVNFVVNIIKLKLRGTTLTNASK